MIVEDGTVAQWVGATCCLDLQTCSSGRHELAKFRLRQVATEGCGLGQPPPPKGGAHGCANCFVNAATEFGRVAVVSVAAVNAVAARGASVASAADVSVGRVGLCRFGSGYTCMSRVVGLGRLWSACVRLCQILSNRVGLCRVGMGVPLQMIQ